jgi:thiamine pyrophosphokinase
VEAGERRGGARHIIVVADGDVPPREDLDAAWPGWATGVEAVIAADGGLARAPIAGLEVSLLVGDLDSVDPSQLARAEEAGLPVRRSSADKDESDTELAVLEAFRLGADRVTILGAFGGGRLDHALANVWLLAHPALAARELVLLDARSRVSVIAAPGPDGERVVRVLPGRLGAPVSLLPFGAAVVGITTHGLRYPLDDGTLVPGPARGLSNVRARTDAWIAVRDGRLLVVESALGRGGLSSPS